MTTNGSKTRPPVWNAKCVHCAFKVEGLTLPDMRAAVSQHERENPGHKCGTHRTRILRSGELP